ncbi:hypothetical protein R8Z50_22555 [Longispora sp. K20-0274]|uniref:amino acid kinase family protein n=1 Tax=Longispora sp. K20-0274 TaxID=3088255 RepID=UPI00399B1277
MLLVLKVSGVAFDPGAGEEESDNFIANLATVMARLHCNYRLAITIGGGTQARALIARAMTLGLDPVRSSKLGADIGLINGRLMHAGLIGAGVTCAEEPIMEFEEAAAAVRLGRVPILYGYWPGLTSDSVAALFASYMKADLMVKLSQVSGVFTDDPRTDPHATVVNVTSPADLLSLAQRYDSRAPGASFVIDMVAIKTLAVARISLLIQHWGAVESIEQNISAIKDANYGLIDGTLVSSDQSRVARD